MCLRLMSKYLITQKRDTLKVDINPTFYGGPIVNSLRPSDAYMRQ